MFSLSPEKIRLYHAKLNILPLAKAGPVSNTGSSSVVTYIQQGKNCCPAAVKEDWMWEKQLRHQGQQRRTGRTPWCAGEEVLLQPVEQIILQATEGPMPEQMDVTSGKMQAAEWSPCRSSFSDRTCDAQSNLHCCSLFLKDCTLWKGLALRQFLRNCSPQEWPTLEELMKDYLPWEGSLAGAREEHDKERASDTKYYELITIFLLHPSVPLRGVRW